MKIEEGLRRWMPEGEADCVYEYAIGSAYPVAVHCHLWETNQLGERRLIEMKTFRLVELKKGTELA